ncbi:MAG: DUF5937 family protein [Acidimicrobiales bacterium]
MEEVAGAVRTLLDPARHAYHLPWLCQATARAADLDLAPLMAVLPKHGYTPDFLTPPPQTPLSDAAAELARIRATPVEQVVRELTWALADRPVSVEGRSMLEDPAATRDRLADLLEACWERLVAPHWPVLRDLLEADIGARSRGLARGGTERLFADLHPQVQWVDGTLQIASPYEDKRDLRGVGLLLVPSVFTWPTVAVMLDPPWQPTLFYPARGIAALWLAPKGKAPAALHRLLGHTRAVLLVSAKEPVTTTALARRLGLAPSTISDHLAALLDAGLVVARRNGRTVHYAQTPLGATLAGAERLLGSSVDAGPPTNAPRPRGG